MNVKSDYINGHVVRLSLLSFVIASPLLRYPHKPQLQPNSQVCTPAFPMCCTTKLVILRVSTSCMILSGQLGCRRTTRAPCEHTQWFVFPATVRQTWKRRKLLEDKRGGISEPVQRCLRYYRQHRRLLYYLEELVIPQTWISSVEPQLL